LHEKADIVQNAIEFAQVLGIAIPKVAILSTSETISSNVPSTIDAAALCKMAPIGDRSREVLWTAHSRLTMLCTQKRLGLSRLTQALAGRLRSWFYRIWNREVCS
jgi:Phosphate acetyl/butaryl transferase